MCAKSQSERQSEILHKLDNVANSLRELGENFRYLDAVVKAGIRQHYVKGQLALILNLNLRIEGDDVRRIGSCLNAKSFESFTGVILHNNVLDSGHWRQGEQNQMLVRDVELVKSVEECAVLPSFVRLYIGDEQIEDGRIRDGVYANPVERTFKVLQRSVDRKLSAFAVKSGDMLFEQSDPSEIERGSEIVNRISDDQSNVVCIFSKLQRVYELLRSSVTIFLDRNTTTCLQRENCPLQVCDMLIGPLDLEASVPEEICEGGNGRILNIHDSSV
jgi:hypothetical protein